jgi:hypothetical protein
MSGRMRTLLIDDSYSFHLPGESTARSPSLEEMLPKRRTLLVAVRPGTPSV